MKKLLFITLFAGCYSFGAAERPQPVFPSKNDVKTIMEMLPPRISGHTAYTAYQLMLVAPRGFYCRPQDETGRNRRDVAELIHRFPAQKQQIVDHVISGYQEFICPDVNHYDF